MLSFSQPLSVSPTSNCHATTNTVQESCFSWPNLWWNWPPSLTSEYGLLVQIDLLWLKDVWWNINSTGNCFSPPISSSTISLFLILCIFHATTSSFPIPSTQAACSNTTPLSPFLLLPPPPLTWCENLHLNFGYEKEVQAWITSPTIYEKTVFSLSLFLSTNKINGNTSLFMQKTGNGPSTEIQLRTFSIDYYYYYYYYYYYKHIRIDRVESKTTISRV